MSFSDETVKRFQQFIGESGKKFFTDWINRHQHGWATSAEQHPDKDGNPGTPHPIHFREGMQVRNWMRGQDEFKNWDDHALDEGWAHLVETALAKKFL